MKISLAGIRVNGAIALILLVFVSTAFQAKTSSQEIGKPTPVSQENPRCEAQKSRLLKASEGLLYPSESDYPFTYFSFDGSSLPGPEEFLQLTGQTGQPITQVNFDDLFGRLTRIEPGMDPQQIKAAQRFRLLERAFRATFKDLTVYRVGEIQIQIYIIGLSTCGVGGLQTISIET